MADRTYIDSSGNWVNLEACTKYISRPVEVAGVDPAPTTVLLKTRLGNFFLLAKRDGEEKAGYEVMSPHAVEAFCLSNGYDPESIVDDVAEEANIGEALNGEM